MSVSVSSGLSVEKVSVAFPGERRRDAPAVAVREVTVEVAPGEVLALLGPSGSGKSTLLRAIAGLEPLADGRVWWAGRDLKDVPVHRRGFALMFQDGQLFPTRTVAANIAYPLKIAGVPRPTQQARVDELLELVGLSGFGGRQVTELSGGEQQRVALARAIAAKPRLLLLDEPLSALDRELRERLGLDLRRILVETGTTTVFVTHDHAEAVTVADRVAVLIAGALVQVGTPAELRQTPRTPEVARFFGAGPLGATPPAVPQLEAER